MALAATLTLRINAPPSFLTRKRNRTQEEEATYAAEEEERWGVVADAAGRLVIVASGLLGGDGIRDVGIVSRFDGVS